VRPDWVDPTGRYLGKCYEFEPSAGYNYRLVHFALSLGTTIVRAYRPDNPLDCLDFDFRSTVFIQLPTFWKDWPLQWVKDDEGQDIRARLGIKYREASNKLFRAGPSSVPFEVLAADCNLTKIDPHDKVWGREPFVGDDFNVEVSPQVLSQLETIIDFGILPFDYWAPTLTLDVHSKSGKHFALSCRNPVYLQLPLDTKCEPFELAGPQDKLPLLERLGLENAKHLNLLKSRANQMPIYILCGEISMRNIQRV